MNNELIGEYVKRATNHQQLLGALKEVRWGRRGGDEGERERDMVEKILIEGRKRNKSQLSEGTPKTKKEVNRGRHTKKREKAQKSGLSFTCSNHMKPNKKIKKLIFSFLAVRSHSG